jgi:hypothetical protein
VKLAVSGTYSSGKTITVMALAHYTGIPRTLARSIRTILPEAVPGKKLSEVTPPEYLQLAMRRHVGRAVDEALRGDAFISDGSSLQEWIYGAVRVRYGMNPSVTSPLVEIEERDRTDEMRFFAAVVDQFGHAFRQHVTRTFDAFVHLTNELRTADDGHRPMNEGFRAACDAMLLDTLTGLQIPYHVVGGSLVARLRRIVDVHGLPTVLGVREAVARATAEYGRLDQRLETERAAASG